MTPEFITYLQPYFDATTFETIAVWLITHTTQDILETLDHIKHDLGMSETCEYTTVPHVFFFLGIASLYFKQKPSQPTSSLLSNAIQKAIANQGQVIYNAIQTARQKQNTAINITLDQPMFEANRSLLEAQGFHIVTIQDNTYTHYIITPKQNT